MAHEVGRLATAAPDATVPPFMNQIDTSPVLLLRHRMSLLPSPSKSPVSAIVKLVGTLPTKMLELMAPVLLKSQMATLPVLSRQMHRQLGENCYQPERHVPPKSLSWIINSA